MANQQPSMLLHARRFQKSCGTQSSVINCYAWLCCLSIAVLHTHVQLFSHNRTLHCVPLQEPDSYGIRWEPTATRPGYGALLLDLMDALYPIIPGSLYFVEGVDQECK